jgi:hypothetical protein
MMSLDDAKHRQVLHTSVGPGGVQQMQAYRHVVYCHWPGRACNVHTSSPAVPELAAVGQGPEKLCWAWPKPTG